MDVVAHAHRVFLDAQQHFDAGALVLLEHLLEDHLHREDQPQTDQEGQHQVAQGALAADPVQDGQHEGREAGEQGQPDLGVETGEEREGSHAHKPGQEGQHQHDGHCQGHTEHLPATVKAGGDAGHGNQDQDGHEGRKDQREDEKQDRQQAGDQDPSGHPFPVADQQETQIDQRGAGLFFQ